MAAVEPSTPARSTRSKPRKEEKEDEGTTAIHIYVESTLLEETSTEINAVVANETNLPEVLGKITPKITSFAIALDLGVFKQKYAASLPIGFAGDITASTNIAADKFKDLAVVKIVDSLASNETIEKLTIYNSNLKATEFFRLIQGLAQNHSIEALDVSGNPITVLRGPGIPKYSISILGKFLEFLNTRTNPPINSLDISDTKLVLSPEYLKFFQGLSKNPHLIQLFLRKIYETTGEAGDPFPIMTISLTTNTVLTTLDLSENDLNSPTRLKALKSLLSANKTLENLIIEKCELDSVFISELMKDGSNLLDLEISGNILGKNGLKTFALILKKNPTLEYLIAKNTGTTDVNALLFKKALRKHTGVASFSLDLQENEIELKTTLEYLEEAVKFNIAIKHMNLTANPAFEEYAVSINKIDEFLDRNNLIQTDTSAESIRELQHSLLFSFVADFLKRNKKTKKSDMIKGTNSAITTLRYAPEDSIPDDVPRLAESSSPQKIIYSEYEYYEEPLVKLNPSEILPPVDEFAEITPSSTFTKQTTPENLHMPEVRRKSKTTLPPPPTPSTSTSTQDDLPDLGEFDEFDDSVIEPPQDDLPDLGEVSDDEPAPLQTNINSQTQSRKIGCQKCGAPLNTSLHPYITPENAFRYNLRCDHHAK